MRKCISSLKFNSDDDDGMDDGQHGTSGRKKNRKTHFNLKFKSLCEWENEKKKK